LLVGNNLTGTVFGLRGGFKGLQYDVFVGTPLRHPKGFRTSDTTAGFNLNYSL
jgi:hemolysin activation/secretion protein